MATRKNQASNIAPIAVIALAMKRVKVKADYDRIAAANTQPDLETAWATLSSEEQARIHQICDQAPQPDLNEIASELIACGTLLELRGLKSSYGPDVVKQAWQLIPAQERMRLKGICQTEQQPQSKETPQPVTQQPPVQVETQAQTQPTKLIKRSLYAIGSDMHQSALELEAKLDATDDPEEQATLIEIWLQESAGLQGEMNERVNAYLHVIKRQKALAEYRASEGKRLRELAEQSENLAKRLEGQLLQFMDSHNIGRLETKDFKVSPRHASQEPLIVDEDYPLDQVPEEFVVVSRAMNRKLIKEHIKAGNQLPFATLGNKSRYLFIR